MAKTIEPDEELLILRKELVYQKGEIEKLLTKLSHSNKELNHHKDEQGKHKAELITTNKEFEFQIKEKEQRAIELGIANTELAFQIKEKEQRAIELSIANKELAFQNNEKEKRAAELGIANTELAFQNDEKGKVESPLLDNESSFYNAGAYPSKQKKVENALKKSEEKFKLIFEKSIAPIMVADDKGNYLEVNKAAAEIFEYSINELTGMNVGDLITSSNSNPAALYEEYIKKGEEIGEFGFISKKGTPKIVQYQAVRIKPDFNLSILMDVTEQKQAPQYARSLIEASLDPLVTISIDGKITDVNEASIKVTGIEREKLVGTNFSNYFTDPEKAKEGYLQVFNNGFVSDYPLTIKHVNGRLTDVMYNASVYKDDMGNVLGVFAAARDVTAQKSLSNYSLSLIEASRDPLFTISPDGKITDMNQATVRVTGESRENLIGTNFYDYFTEPDKARKGYQQVFAKGFVEDYPLTITDGVLTPVLFNGSVYKDDKGNVLGAVVVARDITEQKRIEKELIESKVAAEKATKIAEEAKSKAEKATQIANDAVKAKQQFLSNMSHEIRTPMNAIIGFTKVVLKTDLTAKQKEYLTAIKMSGDALIVLINDILDLAKVDAGKMTFEKTAFKMALSISAMMHLFETKVQEKNLKLILDYDTKIPEVLLGDAVRLHQIILNLLSNAVKFTLKGDITVRVSLLEEDTENAVIEFSVKDTGIGIPKDKIERIFENFQQASSGTSRLYGGTGLGLAIVKQLIQTQGGSIQVNSELNEGSIFSFTLPFQKTNMEVEVSLELVESDAEIRNIKVLVVEDMALNQLLMKTLLDDFGFERDIAENGKIGIEKLQSKSYDIILMDLQMPEMNGFEATDYIRKTMNSQIPIIALTADVTTVDLEKCKAVGMNDYIAKPVDERLLYSKIVSLVKKPAVVKTINLAGSDDQQINQTKCIDLDYLMQRTKSNPKLMMEMIGAYLEQTPPLVSAMKQSLLDKDWQLLHSAVHKMIPSFLIVGINENFEKMAKQIQEYASTQQQTDGIHDLVLKLENVCAQACKELEIEFNRIKKQHNEK